MDEERIEGGERAFGDLTRRVIHGEERLSEIISRFETKFEKLNDSIQELNRTIAAIGKPDYKTWGALGGVVCAVAAGISSVVWLLVITPLNDQAKTIVPRSEYEKELQRLESEIASKLSTWEFNNKVIAIDGKFAKDEADIDALKERLSTRGHR